MVLLLVVLLFHLVSSQDPPFRLPGSPYPYCTSGPNTVQTLYTISSSQLSATQLLTAQTLQGILARGVPTIFEVGDGSASDQQTIWLNYLQQNFNVKVNTSFSGNFVGLLSSFLGKISGYILCDVSSGDSVNTALTLSAASEAGSYAVVVDVQDESTVNSLGLRMIADARQTTIAQVLQEYKIGVNFTNQIADLQDPTKYNFLSDWSVFGRAVTWFDTDPNLASDTSKTILSSLKPESAIFGWGVAEGNTVDVLAKYGQWIHASDWAPNLSALSNFYVPAFAQKRATSSASAKQTRADAPGKHTVAFLMTDGDNIQWLVTGFATPGGLWYGSPDRGKVPLGWTVSAALSEVAPSILQNFYQSQVLGKDNFVAGPSGLGYTIPDHFSNSDYLETFASLSSSYAKRADLKIVNIINDGSSLDNLYPFLNQPDISAIFDYYGDCYCGAQGQIWWYNGKPIIGGRAALWGSYGDGDCQNDESSLSYRLKLLPKDPRNPQSYSLVPVHVWTHNVTSVVNMNQLLGSDFFDVVTPEELLSRIQTNVFHDCSNAPSAGGSYTGSCTNCEQTCGSLRNCRCGAGSGMTAPVDYFDYTVCNQNLVANCNGKLVCQGDPCTCPSAAASGSYEDSCKNCQDNKCGLLLGCTCNGPYGATTIPVFDYSVCNGSLVANCDGALICQGQPC